MNARDGTLRIPLVGLATASVVLALACLAVLAVVASVKNVDTLSTIALALAVVAFVAQLIVFVVQTGAANQQMLQSQHLHAELLSLLGEMRERARGTDETVSTINERLLEAALGKALGTGSGAGSNARAIATEVAAILNASGEPIVSQSSAPFGNTIDQSAHEAAARLFQSFPDPSASERAVETLEDLSIPARLALTEFAKDERNYAGTDLGPGIGADMPGGRELSDRRLVVPRTPQSSLYVLTEPARDAARILTADDEPPGHLADRIRELRSILS